jgi:hypothetical protein
MDSADSFVNHKNAKVKTASMLLIFLVAYDLTDLKGEHKRE